METPSASPDGGTEERALVERMLAGDEQAMEEFADGYFPGLYRFARARLGGDSELAREIVQTTVCKALDKLSTFRGSAPLFSWLCACCRNEIGMHFRRRKRWGNVVAIDEAISEPELAPNPGRPRRPADPEQAAAQKQEARQVHETLDHLPPRYARALEWKYVEQRSVEEIAGRLACSVKAAESLLSRARRAFRERWHAAAGTVWNAAGTQVQDVNEGVSA
jgi:RNA polymerase sigma-70 factor (ECF subfamily)